MSETLHARIQVEKGSEKGRISNMDPLGPPRTDREVWGDKIADETIEAVRKRRYPPTGTYKVYLKPVSSLPRERTPEEEKALSERVLDALQGHLWCLSDEEWEELKRREDERRSAVS